MKRIVPAIIVASVGLSLVAQTTGSIQGTVLDSKGKPITGAKVVVSKVDITWVKELKVSTDGKFFQIGFVPGEYEITVSAPGFNGIQEKERIGLGLVLQKKYVLLTPGEAAKSGNAGADPSAVAGALGLESFNQAVGLFNEKKHFEALPLFEEALARLEESLAKSTAEAERGDIQKTIQTIERPFGFSLVEVGKKDEARRFELYTKAESMIIKTIDRNPKDQNALLYMLEIASTKNDLDAVKKYQAALDAILGPRPELAYNQGVELYNAGKLAEAKPFFLKSLGVKADFADAYYLLAMCEFSENNLKGTKANLQKYIELAPTGKHAAEVKAMLADPSLKNVK